ncbi:MAG: hypothetical protein DRP87_19920 [Spirochaetes bacterium]|nr:MAG: hypothetical protein DRP87_19920 [Spirochaetota bacterium]
MNRRVTGLIIVFMVVVIGSVFSAQEAVLKGFSGKVEVREPGGVWESAEAGAVLSMGTTVSTGFGSTALLDLGASVIQVKQLTRMTVEELVQKEGTISTSLFLNVGRVKAEVKSVEGLTHEFTLRSTVSVSSVRGTEFEYDGYELIVTEGVVLFFNRIGQKRTIAAGQTSETTGLDVPAPPAVTLSTVAAVTTSTSPVTEEAEAERTPVIDIEHVETSNTGSITVTLE